MSDQRCELETLTRVEHAGARQSGGLQIFDLKWPVASSDLNYLTLDEALQSGVVAITEFSEGGEVPALRVVNQSSRMIFLMAGELSSRRTEPLRDRARAVIWTGFPSSSPANISESMIPKQREISTRA